MQEKLYRYLTICILIILPIYCFALTSEAANQELMRLEVSGFPLHVGMSVKASFWKNFRTDFAPLADMVKRDSTIRVYLRASNDLTEYNPQSHDDALEMALHGSRDMAVALQLENIGVPEKQIVFLLPGPPVGRGPQFRKVAITVTRETLPDYVTRKELMEILANLPKPEPAPPSRKDTVVVLSNSTAVWIGIGATYNSFGTIMPIVQGRAGNKCVSFGAEVGHSISSYDKRYGNADFSIQYRMASCFITYTPFWNVDDGLLPRLELIGGAHDTYAIAKRYGKYTERDLGLELGLGFSPIPHITLEAVWSLDQRSTYGDEFVHSRLNNFRLSVVLSTLILGGGK